MARGSEGEGRVEEGEVRGERVWRGGGEYGEEEGVVMGGRCGGGRRVWPKEW